ncbi:unnamed protein product [Nesidiocoris tenuis]|uniref:Ig-like domain-containing protein n=1 Tax=Nesidiocoris tenuis TaxID=355587 RepID=A0A6H5GDV5_9HEMI|nr:unnamed protein product [Nesidiocoris tenuis]
MSNERLDGFIFSNVAPGVEYGQARHQVDPEDLFINARLPLHIKQQQSSRGACACAFLGGSGFSIPLRNTSATIRPLTPQQGQSDASNQFDDYQFCGTADRAREHTGGECLRLLRLSVPPYKMRGESAFLECDYDLEGNTLYAVKWYKDNEEFYRYVPRASPPQHSYNLEGVRVIQSEGSFSNTFAQLKGRECGLRPLSAPCTFEILFRQLPHVGLFGCSSQSSFPSMEQSNAKQVVLRTVNLKSIGDYRCEVSAEKPRFVSDSKEARMEVISASTTVTKGPQSLATKGSLPELISRYICLKHEVSSVYIASDAAPQSAAALFERRPAAAEVRRKSAAVAVRHNGQRSRWISFSSSSAARSFAHEPKLELILSLKLKLILNSKVDEKRTSSYLFSPFYYYYSQLLWPECSVRSLLSSLVSTFGEGTPENVNVHIFSPCASRVDSPHYRHFWKLSSFLELFVCLHFIIESSIAKVATQVLSRTRMNGIGELQLPHPTTPPGLVGLKKCGTISPQWALNLYQT